MTTDNLNGRTITMSTIKRAYMEISNGIRGLRFNKDQPNSVPSSSKDTSSHLNKYVSNGNTHVGARVVRSPKPLIARKIRSLFGRHQPDTIHELFMDDRFLAKFFYYFSAEERGVLSRVCHTWKNLLYHPKYWENVMPVLVLRNLNKEEQSRRLLYESLQYRCFDSVCLFGAVDEEIADFINHCATFKKQIKFISLRNSNITDTGLEILCKKMPCLYKLELSGCNELTETGMWSCLNPKIVSLTVKDCINIADDTVGAIAQLLPALYELNIQAYHVTDAALAFFSTKQSYSLSVLRLQSCWEVTNHGIVNIVHSLPNLTVLSLSGCSKITDDGVELIAENLRKLRCFDLSWCPRVTDASLEYIACDLNQLEELVLDRFV